MFKVVNKGTKTEIWSLPPENMSHPRVHGGPPRSTQYDLQCRDNRYSKGEAHTVIFGVSASPSFCFKIFSQKISFNPLLKLDEK